MLVARGGAHQRPVSIHAPGRGATGKDARDGEFSAVSIHAPGRGATAAKPEHQAQRGLVSIHAPGRGATITRLRSSQAR